MMPTNRTHLGLATIAVVACSFSTGCTKEPALEAAPSMVPSTSATGLELYVAYCQSCHGTTGKGDGPVAPLLTVATPDLTTMITRYGEYPEELVASTMDGRAEIAAHGTREMPVWGNLWSDPNNPLAEETMASEIQKLVTFLRTIQADS